MKNFNQKKMLSVTVSMLMTLTVCQSISVWASDIEIYKDATIGKTSILMMLDTSGSMGISSLVLPKNNRYGSPGDVDVSLCDRVQVAEYYNNGTSTSNIYQWAYNLRDPSTNRTAIKKTVNVGGTNVDYYVRGCTNQKGDVKQYDRLSRLKDAIIPLLASSDLSNDVLMGLGQFSSKTELTIGTATNRLTDGHSGRILVPNAALTSAQRIKIAQQIAAIKSLDTTTNEDGTPNPDLKLSSKSYPNVTKAASGTPTAHAYAEAAAYMMGTVTGTGGVNSGIVDTIYDGYMVMQNGDQQVYFICVAVGSGTTNALGATVKQCINNWPGYDSGNKTVSTGTVSGGIYKSDGTRIENQTAFKNEVGAMNSGWETFTKLPVGWRYGGWMKVDNEPMDIEPIVGTVWGGYAGGTIGIVSYRTSPFSIKSQTVNKTVITQGFQDCPAGYSVDSWYSLCVSTYGPFYRRATSSAQCTNDGLIKGRNPVLNARNLDGTPNSNETYNRPDRGLVNLRYVSSNNENYRCVQDKYAIARPWGDIQTTVTEIVPIDNNGGFAYSAADTKNSAGTAYQAGGSTNSCDGNGIYFLTDGAPNSTKDSMARTILNKTLNNDNKYIFTAIPTGSGVLISPKLQSGLFDGETGGWEYIGEYAKKLFDPNQNPGNMKIKTAVVGFGSSFAGIPIDSNGFYDCETVKNTNPDAYNACKWGGNEFGNGGFYYAENSEDIKKSIIDFVEKAKATIDPVATGAPTIPQDALNPLQIQPYGYYASFTPKPQATYRLWLGNLNKYHVYGGQLYDKNKSLRLITETGALNKDAQGLWTDGMTAQLPLGIRLDASQLQVANRTILTNRQITSAEPYTAAEINTLKKVNVTTLFGDGENDGQPIGLFKNDPAKNYWLNLLGYRVGALETNISLTDLVTKPELRQIGAVMHSTPILLTQQGKITVTNGKLTTTGREDYLLFGSTQGLLHVVNANDGKEVFAFAPHEMMEKQKDAFLFEENTSGGKSKLFYGIDAPWTAYTQYVAKSDGTLTVYDSGRTVKPTDDGDEIAVKGLQWVYGGLRMGGRSYYALDLSNMNSPKLKFHIDPEHEKIIKSNGTVSVPALQYMGESWSKPTLAYVNFGGVKKLVMFVGGGYSRTNDNSATVGYENTFYDQKNKEGAGVYMFDANTGDLLWWTSANATEAKGAEAFTNTSDSAINMQYSVVSQINAIDRNGDGLADHLYFGDLGGQAFRVDIDNTTATTSGFAKHVVRLFTEHQDLGKSPRFYEMPSVSIHQNNGEYFAAVAFSSGNRSAPLSGDIGKNNTSKSTSAADGVFVVYDKDVAKSNLYALTDTALTTKSITLQSLDITKGVAVSSNHGWKYLYPGTVVGRYKGMNGLYAISNMLYVNVFDRDGVGIGSNCGAGVAGDSYLYQFCLPTGKCDFALQKAGEPNRVKVGAGILGTAMGGTECIGEGCDGDGSLIKNVVTSDTDCTVSANKNLPQCQVFGVKAGLKQLRWYELR